MTRAWTISATRRGLSALLGAVLVAGLTALAAPPATSATPWLPEVEATAAPADEIRQTATATGPDGTFVMAWVENLDGNDRSWTVQVATRAPGAAGFSTPVEAAPPGSNLRRLVLVVDATGATTVVWNRRVDAGIYGLEVAHRAAGAAGFAAPETLSSSVAGFSGVGDDQGRVTVAWTRAVLNPEGQVVTTVAETATWEPDLADWSASTLLDVGNLGPPDLAVDGAGVVTMAWVERMDAQSLLRTRRRPVGSALFDIAQTPLVAGSSFATNPDVASNAAGDTVVVWGLGTGFDGLMQVAVRSAGAVSFGDPIDVATAAHVEAPLVAIDGAGTATVAWSEVTDVARVWVATALAGGAFTPPVQVDSGGDRAVALTLSGSAAGASVLAWIYRWDASGSRVARAAYRPAGGSFGATIDLTERVVGVLDDEVAASIDPDGSAFVAWARRTLAEGFLYRAYARVLDGRGPVLPAVAVPATGTAGSAVAMSAPASDLWSGPPTITWNFGDGGTGAGASTSHVYAAAGSYTVRVTATDGAGNSTTLTRTIVVGPAAVPDSTAPVLSGARLSPGRLPTGEGARLRVTSTERAALAGVVQRRREGRWRAVGTKRWSLRAGANDRVFYGKTAEQRLTSGTYRVRLTATDPAGNTSATTTIRFRVDRG